MRAARKVGIDLSPRQIEAARARLPAAEFHVQAGETLELDEKFDYIILSDTLNLAADVQQMLERLQRQTDTAFVVVTRDRGAPPPGTEVFLQQCYERGVGVYPSVARAARAVSRIRQWRFRREGLPDIL